MSDLRYYVTAKSKGKKPYVMFLTYEGFWDYGYDQPQVLDLREAKKTAANEPTHCLFVEAKDGLRQALSDIFEEEEKKLSYKEFEALIKNLHCKTASTRKEKKQPETQAKETSEEEREYVLYYSKPNAAWNSYYERGGGETFDKSEAYIMTLSEASDKLKELSAKGQYQWVYKKVKIEPAIEEETPAPEAKKKKHFGYVLHTPPEEGEIFYYAGGRDDLSTRINGKKAKLYRTEEGAQFAADVLNVDLSGGWQVEQIEF